MLRYVFWVFRRQRQAADGVDPEEWVEYMRLPAHDVDRLPDWLCLEDWVFSHRQRKWKLAGQLARCQDGRWSRKVLEWGPQQYHLRSQGRPRLRWSDSLESFAGGDWMSLAVDPAKWSILTPGFVSYES